MTTYNKLKMFVWTGVLCDYSCGMVCVLAHDVEEARHLGYEEIFYNPDSEALDSEPEVITEPKAFAVRGWLT